MTKSKADPVQIQQRTFDEENNAVRTSMLPQAMAIEVNADDGDSVLVRKEMEVELVISGQVVDVSKCSRICFFSSNPAVINLWAKLANAEFELGSLALGVIEETCFPALKVVISGEGPVYIVKQS